jgi:hypothetical protein
MTEPSDQPENPAEPGAQPTPPQGSAPQHQALDGAPSGVNAGQNPGGAPQNPYGAAQYPAGAPQHPAGALTNPYGATQNPAGAAPNPYASAPSPYATGPTKRRKLSRGGLIGIIAGAVVLVIIVVTAAGIGISSAISGAQGDPESIVTDYLTAVQDGDAKQALSYLDESISDKTLLTDDVLKASAKLGKISKIKLTSSKEDSSTTKVTAKFSVGSTPVTQEFTVYKAYKGGYSILSGGTVSLYPSTLDGVAVTVNGQEAKGDSWTVFPGAYELALPKGVDASFSISGADDLVAAGDGYDLLSDVKVELNEAGVQQFRDAVTEAVNACIASTTLAAGCGLDVPATLSDGTVIADGTLTRTLSADAQANLANLEPRETFSNPLQVYGDYIGSVKTSSTSCTQNGSTTGCDIWFGPSLGSPQVDFTSGTPVVRWD